MERGDQRETDRHPGAASERPRVIAEIGQGKGRIDYVTEALAMAQRAGCWAGKVQLLQPDAIAQPGAGLYWDERRPGITDQRTSFGQVGCLAYEDLAQLRKVADTVGIELVATPFDLDAVEAMVDAGVRWCKVASGDITNRPLLEAVREAFADRVILSTGAAYAQEIEDAIAWLGEPWAVLACTLSYPTRPEHAELRRIPTLKRLLAEHAPGALPGYSDHTHESSTAGFAVAAGAHVLEKHFTLDRDDGSVPDNGFAVDPDAMAAYVEAADTAHSLLGDGLLAPIPAELPARTGARRSICAARDLPAGHRITTEDATMLRPALDDGFAPNELHQVTGRVTRSAVAAGEAITRSRIH